MQPRFRIVPLLLALAVFAADGLAADKPSARFVRISLSGEKRVLTLAEVEVISGGKNIAPSGKATQSSVGAGGTPERGIDGNKDADVQQEGPDPHRRRQ